MYFKVLILLSLFVFFSFDTSKESNGSHNATSKDSSIVNVPQSIFYYQAVRLLNQEKNMDCWAVALSILYSWKNSDSEISVRDVVSHYGVMYTAIYEGDKGILPTDLKDLCDKANLEFREYQNPSINSWYQWLYLHGPLGVALDISTDIRPIVHAIIINGISGDGNPDNTFITFVDPANGNEKSLTFTLFLSAFQHSIDQSRIIYFK